MCYCSDYLCSWQNEFLILRYNRITMPYGCLFSDCRSNRMHTYLFQKFPEHFIIFSLLSIAILLNCINEGQCSHPNTSQTVVNY